MAVLYANNASSRLSASITNVATSFSVTSGTGALFPAITGGDVFYATLMDSSGNLEIVKVTARSSDTFTVVRGQDGTTARAYAVNDIVELRITKAMLDDFKTDTRTGYLPLAGGTVTGATTFSAAVSFSAGTVSAPAITTTGDPNTGIFFPAADTIAFAEGGAEVVRIDSSGNVGVGTNAATVKLDVNGPVKTRGQFPANQTSSGGMDFRSDTHAIRFLSWGSVGNNGTFEWLSGAGAGGATSRMFINGSGNVGIGTSSPSSLLHVNGGLTTGSITARAADGEGGQISLLNTGNTAAAYNFDVDASNHGRLFTTQNNTNLSIGQLSGTGGILTLFTGGAERLRIDASGNVGISTTSPGYNLAVAGTFGIRTASPTVYLQDSDHNSAFLHCNSSYFYILRGATDSNTWTMVGSYWPAYWDLANNNATFGGNLWCAGTVTGASDEKLKANWEDLPENFLELLAQVKHGTFDRIDIGGRQVGVSAQSMLQVLPEAVDRHEKEDVLSVSYGNAALVSAVQLAKRILQLEARIAALENGAP